MKKSAEKKIIQIFIILVLTLFSITQITSSEETFNLRAEIPQEYQNIDPGNKIWFTTKILNLANLGRVDVTLKYTILEGGTTEIATKSETVAIETQASFVGNIKLPDTAKAGTHTIKVEMITANGDISETETTFNIKEKKSIIKENYKYLIIAIVIVIVILIILKLKEPFKRFLEKRKLKQKIKDLIKEKIKSNKITKEELKSARIKEQPKQEETKENEEKYY